MSVLPNIQSLFGSASASIDRLPMFRAVFERTDNPGFDCVVGNPPWERVKVQEREFFSFSAPNIAAAVNAADRRKLIAELESNRDTALIRMLRAREGEPYDR